MKILNVALCALIAGSFTALASGAVAAPISSGLGAPTGHAFILITDYGDDGESCNDCGGYDEPQYQAPKEKKKSKTDQFLEALGKAAEQAAAQERERRRLKAIRDEERRQQNAAESERRRQQAAEKKARDRAAAAERKQKAAAAAAERKRNAAAAEAERKKREAAAKAEKARKAAAAEKERQKRKAAQAEADRQKGQAEADKKELDDQPKPSQIEELDTADSQPRCEGQTCPEGESLDGDCQCKKSPEFTETTTIDGKDPVTIYPGTVGNLPDPHDVATSTCELKIGNTIIYCDAWIPEMPPARETCRGRTANGCYLRTVKVSGLDGQSEQACMTFCKERRPPIVQTVTPSTPEPKKPVVVDKKPEKPVTKPGTPAVKTATATPLVEPKLPATPAVKTALATPYVEPKRAATPAVKTALATPYVEPKKGPTPAVKTALATPYTEPKSSGSSAVPTVAAAPYAEPDKQPTRAVKTAVASPVVEQQSSKP